MGRSTHSWEAEEVLEKLQRERGATAVNILKEFKQRLAESSDRRVDIEWRGSSRRKDEHATLWPWIEYEQITYYPPACFRVDGEVEVPLRYLKGLPRKWNDKFVLQEIPEQTPFNDEEKRQKLLDRTNEIPGVGLSGSVNSRPTFRLSVLRTEEAQERLVEVFNWYISEIIAGERGSAEVTIEQTVDSDLQVLQEEEEYFEGQNKQRYTNYYERNKKLRAAAIEHHGMNCKVCSFNFEDVYGEHGAGYIEVHHLRPVSSLGEGTKVDPRNDMTVVCSNCHRMIHRRKDKVLTPIELQSLLRKEIW